MKIITAITALIFISGFVFGQDAIDIQIDDESNVFFEQIIEVKGSSKDDLFLLGKEWVYDIFRSGDRAIDLEDKENGKIICKSRTQDLVYSNMGKKMDGGHFTYKMTLQFKEGKSRIKFENFHYVKGEMLGLNEGAKLTEEYPETWIKLGKKTIQKQWVLMKDQTLKEIKYLNKSFFEAILKETEDDW